MQIDINYYDIPMGTIEKALKSHGYLKYNYAPSQSVGFSQPNVQLMDKSYMAQNLYIFKRYYEVGIAHDGMLVIECKPLNAGIQHKSLMTVFLLKTSMLTPSNAIDSLITGKVPGSFSLNSFLSNSPCLFFENVALCTTPIYIHSSFANFVTPQYVSVNLLNPYSATSTPFETGMMIVPGSSVLPGGSLANITEGMTTATKKPDLSKTKPSENKKHSDQQPEEETTCSPYEDTANISDIAMVPVNSDFLNGVYQISMIRQLTNYFISIMIILISVMVYPRLYEFFVLKYVTKVMFPSDYARAKHSINLLGSIFLFLLLSVGITLTLSGSSASNVNALYVGMGFSISLIFGAVAINYYTVSDWALIPSYTDPLTKPLIMGSPSLWDSFFEMLKVLGNTDGFSNIGLFMFFVELITFISLGVGSTTFVKYWLGFAMTLCMALLFIMPYCGSVLMSRAT